MLSDKLKQAYLNLKPVTNLEDAIVEIPSLCFSYPVPVYESDLALDSTEHTCRREKRTSVVVSGCGQTVSFRQDGLWQHNGLVVGRMTELPVIVVRVYLSWRKLLKRHVFTFYITLLSSKMANDTVLPGITVKFLSWKCVGTYSFW